MEFSVHLYFKNAFMFYWFVVSSVINKKIRLSFEVLKLFFFFAFVQLQNSCTFDNELLLYFIARKRAQKTLTTFFVIYDDLS
jgi:hypothetical protein